MSDKRYFSPIETVRKKHSFPPRKITEEDRKRWTSLTLTGKQIMDLAQGESEYVRRSIKGIAEKMAKKE